MVHFMESWKNVIGRTLLNSNIINALELSLKTAALMTACADIKGELR